MKRILIVGANFNNKGAQSMLFTTVSEIKKISNDSEIYFATTQKYKDKSNYLFKGLCYSERARQIALEERGILVIAESVIKDAAKTVIRRRNDFLWAFMDLKQILPKIDLIIDISGFAIGEKWSIQVQEKYLDGIRLAKKYDIPMILMPQSFGPFDYDNQKNYILEEIDHLFKYPDIIFAREKEGYNDLIQKFGLKNVQFSTDLVLQNTGVITKFVYKDIPLLHIPNIVGKGAVGVIPNMQCFVHGDKKNILEYYTTVINLLLSKGKEVYIFRHSREDITACQWIYELVKDNAHVHILENDFSCIEYDEFIKKFDFIICSRYHGIVHAYRNAVPAIIWGWAVKYTELADLMGQDRYVYNITDDKIDINDMKSAVLEMLSNWQQESGVIRNKVIEVQQSSCFLCLRDYL